MDHTVSNKSYQPLAIEDGLLLVSLIHTKTRSDLASKVFVDSGLGGISGAQTKAAVIAGIIGVGIEILSSLPPLLPCIPLELSSVLITPDTMMIGSGL